MKNLLLKIFSVLKITKGKKPIVIILSIVGVSLLYYASTKGWISFDSINIEQLVNGISSVFPTATIENPVESSVLPVDSLTLKAINDSLGN